MKVTAKVLEASGAVFDAAEEVFMDDAFVTCTFAKMLVVREQPNEFACPKGCTRRCGCSRLGRYFVLPAWSVATKAA